VPFGSDVVVIKGVARFPIVSISAAVATCGFGTELSVTWNVKFVVPSVVGVPLITPVDAFSDNPPGSGLLPGASEKVNGAIPPVTVNFCEYGTLTWPLASEVVVKIGGPGFPTITVAVASGTLGKALA
jgi:hypothetical protein